MKKRNSKTTTVKSSAAKKRLPDSNKSAAGKADNQLPGVHVIGGPDNTGHFGKTAGDFAGSTEKNTVFAGTDKKLSEQPEVSAAPSPKATVNIQLDQQVWQQTEAAAKLAGMEISQYVEAALTSYSGTSRK